MPGEGSRQRSPLRKGGLAVGAPVSSCSVCLLRRGPSSRGRCFPLTQCPRGGGYIRKPGLELPTPWPQEPALKASVPLPRSTFCSIIAQLTEETQPVFETTLKSRAVSQDSDVRFTCVVTGESGRAQEREALGVEIPPQSCKTGLELTMRPMRGYWTLAVHQL